MKMCLASATTNSESMGLKEMNFSPSREHSNGDEDSGRCDLGYDAVYCYGWRHNPEDHDLDILF
jgi:hypothetical protein